MATEVRLAIALAFAIASSAGAEPRAVELTLRSGALLEADRVVRVRQGDDVTLRWTSDVPLDVHLHGYDIEITVVAGAPRVMRFAARATGRFPIEAHAGTRTWTIGYLEVHPR